MVALRDTPDAWDILGQVERFVDQGHRRAARPALLRTRGRLLAARGDLLGALQVLLDSVNLARDHGNLVQQGRSLYTLMQVAFAAGEQQVFERMAGERRTVMDEIGRQVRGLAWCAHLP